MDFECSTVCPTLLGVIGIWQKRLGSWARWRNKEIKGNPTQVSGHLENPEEPLISSGFLIFFLLLFDRISVMFFKCRIDPQSFEMSPSELLVNMGSNCSLEDFYPSVAISALMRIIRDHTLSEYHTEVVLAVTYIFRQSYFF